MAKKKTRVQEPRGPGPKGSIPRVQEPKKKPWAMSIERAQVKPLSELPLGPVKKRVKPPWEKKPLTITKIRPPKGREPMKIKPPPIGLGMEHPGLLKTPLSKPTLKSGEVRPPHKPGPPIPERRVRKHITPVGHIPPIRKHETLAPRRPPPLKRNIKKR